MTRPEPTDDGSQGVLRGLRQFCENPRALDQLGSEQRDQLAVLTALLSKTLRTTRKKMEVVDRKKLRKRRRKLKKKILAETAMRKMRNNPILLTPRMQTGRTNPQLKIDQKLQFLESPAQCYVCHKSYTEVHQHYDQLCIQCGERNLAKRTQTGDLTGYLALVTGGRDKIGYHVALFLLRAGCIVIVTTRFPTNALSRFALERDYDIWKLNLDIRGLNLRRFSQVERFCAELKKDFKWLDFIVHNACQTIARPREYYSEILAGEEEDFFTGDLSDDEDESDASTDSDVGEALQTAAGYANKLKELDETRDHNPTPLTTTTADKEAAADRFDTVSNNQIWQTSESYDDIIAALQQQRAAETETTSDGGSDTEYSTDDFDSTNENGSDTEEESDIDEFFPVDPLTREQIDLRPTNSWRLYCDEISVEEMRDVMFINALAPLLINGRLKEMLKASPNPHKYVVNVSAMEGQFYRRKTARHCHTNMAKAALNMHTRTSHSEFSRFGIFMVSVDTGWITNENPYHMGEYQKKKYDFTTPLDEVDGAARIVDPIFMAVNHDSQVGGVFLKDYEVTDW